MSNKEKDIVQELSKEELGAVPGGFVDQDKHTHAEYNKVGISHQCNVDKKDEY